MALTCDFYNYEGPPNKIKKQLTEEPVVGNVSCTPYEPFDDLHGYIIIGYNANVEGCNYCKIGERYYYITDFVKKTGSQLEVRLELDFLKTFADDILDTDAYVFRTSQQPAPGENPGPGYNMYMNDRKIPLVAYDLLTVVGSGVDGAVEEFKASDYSVYSSIIGTEGTAIGGDSNA